MSTSEPTTAVARQIHPNHSTLSLLSTTYATALDVCATMYGAENTATDAIERFYEASASPSHSPPPLDPPNSLTVYENPVLTATSRSVIAEIHSLSRNLSAIDVPRPIALLCTLFRLEPPQGGLLGRNINEPLFQALRVWTDVGDICENESFDGHRKTIVEHTLNILILPGIHREGRFRGQPQHSTDSLLTNTSQPGSPQSQSHSHSQHPPTLHHPHPHLTAPALPIPGTALTVPSPLHLTLPIITRLAFNEQGHITHHRDFWDVKDVLGLVPGVSLAQWIATRVAAKGIVAAAGVWPLRVLLRREGAGGGCGWGGG
ncbi:hypothetical protein MKEN_00150000 [Mycena kentingensis (nom. inval.)]|nr:hypothetical protein MKEN_00150000 [Mycena kentingensis (nom. inval.)]